MEIQWCRLTKYVNKRTGNVVLPRKVFPVFLSHKDGSIASVWQTEDEFQKVNDMRRAINKKEEESQSKNMQRGAAKRRAREQQAKKGN